MIDYIKEMIRTAGVEPKYEDCCKIADKYWNNEELANEYATFDNYMNKNCAEGDSGACFSTCEYAYDKKIYPDFTPEKQMQIIRLIIHKIASFDREHKDFTQALAQLTTELIKAGELDKEKVRKVLE